MIINAQDLNSAITSVNGQLIPARPVSGPFILRIKAAWLVLLGKADAVVWPVGETGEKG